MVGNFCSKPFISIAIFVTSFILVHSQGSNNSTEYIARIGQSINLTCPVKVGAKLRYEYCIWDRPNQLNASSLWFDSKSGQNGNLSHAYAFNDNGRGDCGIHVKNLTQADLAKWVCIAITFPVSGTIENRTTVEGIVRIVEAVEPTKPQILQKEILSTLVDSDTGRNNTVNITCCSKNGIPPPMLNLTVGEKLGSDDMTNRTLNPPGSICVNWENARFTWMDHGSTLACNLAIHPAHSTELNLKDELPLNILHGPRLLDIPIPDVILSANTTSTELTLAISANPIPFVTAALQNIDDNSTPHVLDFNLENGLKMNEYALTLNISTAKNATLYLTMVNPYGVANYTISVHYVVNLVDNPAEDDNLETSLPLKWIGVGAGILGIVILALVGIAYFKSRQSRVDNYPLQARARAAAAATITVDASSTPVTPNNNVQLSQVRPL